MFNNQGFIILKPMKKVAMDNKTDTPIRNSQIMPGLGLSFLESLNKKSKNDKFIVLIIRQMIPHIQTEEKGKCSQLTNKTWLIR